MKHIESMYKKTALNIIDWKRFNYLIDKVTQFEDVGNISINIELSVLIGGYYCPVYAYDDGESFPVDPYLTMTKIDAFNESGLFYIITCQKIEEERFVIDHTFYNTFYEIVKNRFDLIETNDNSTLTLKPKT